MNSKKSNPVIESCSVHDDVCMKFTFTGTLTEAEARIAAKEWRNFFSKLESEKCIIIWQCKEMTGYEPMARTIWQETLHDVKSQIKSIWLVTESRAIKTGAKIMSLFTSFPINIVTSEDKIYVSSINNL